MTCENVWPYWLAILLVSLDFAFIKPFMKGTLVCQFNDSSCRWKLCHCSMYYQMHNQYHYFSLIMYHAIESFGYSDSNGTWHGALSRILDGVSITNQLSIDWVPNTHVACDRRNFHIERHGHDREHCGSFKFHWITFLTVRSLTLWGLVTSYVVEQPGHNLSMWWFIAWSALSIT